MTAHLEWTHAEPGHDIAAYDGHRYAVKGNLGAWSVFYAQPGDALAPLHLITGPLPSITAAKTTAEAHLQRLLERPTA